MKRLTRRLHSLEVHALLDRRAILRVEKVRLNIALRDRNAYFGLVPSQDEGRRRGVVEGRLWVDCRPLSGTEPRRCRKAGLLLRRADARIDPRLVASRTRRQLQVVPVQKLRRYHRRALHLRSSLVESRRAATSFLYQILLWLLLPFIRSHFRCTNYRCLWLLPSGGLRPDPTVLATHDEIATGATCPAACLPRLQC